MAKRSIKTVAAGDRFGEWTIIERDGRGFWCRCSCGEIRRVAWPNLFSGSSTRCAKCRVKAITKHGQCGTPDYEMWRTTMTSLRRRGEPYDPAWKSFEAFMRDVGNARPAGHHYALYRRDPSQPHSAANSFWAGKKNRKPRHFLTAFGQTRSLSDWARLTGINRTTLFMRVYSLGWSAEEALQP